MELLSLYGLFLAKMITILGAFAVFAVLIIHIRQRKSDQTGELKFFDLGKKYKEIEEQIRLFKMCESEQKIFHKTKKKQKKLKAKFKKQKMTSGQHHSQKPCIYVIDFNGSIDAHQVSSLREEVSAILSVMTTEDSVFLRLESPGGVVHGYGLAASQLARFRQAGVSLVVSVDKIAASGGYMMACVGDHILSAPFAIIGSIGVVAQIPNFHRFLQKNNIDVELHTAGEFKRTLTVFGENTEQGREKFCEELNETHLLFKQFVQEKRPQIDINTVSTGEHWFGVQAKEKGLVDSIGTSDDWLISKMENHQIIRVSYQTHKSLIERLTGSMVKSADRLLLRWWRRGEKPFI
ncbi:MULTISPECIES: protease SohB [Candidatus Williamhamiltonella]|uniref:Protease SohB n=1 Tax=Candidatus Williamhamiltonella defendens TaxID=138072 RepID=A0A2D3TCG2_9ENTR|nr:protease SohB [Candidatus Hamiltonella defensa]ATW33469.1 protease SohB [Candidatus Hamiltonella defensa]AYB49377.1 protease SohB [Candidatus Hamiltonella defensa]